MLIIRILTLFSLILVFVWDRLYLFDEQHLLTSIYFICFSIVEVVLIIKELLCRYKRKNNLKA